jgi:hypothetical protein
VKHALLLLVAIVSSTAMAAGCSSSANDHPSDAPDSSTGADTFTDDTTPDAALETIDETADTSNAISIPATNATWHATEDVTFTGKGSADLGAIDLTHGVGTIVFKGETVPAFFYTSTSTPTGTDDSGTFAGERDFEVVALAPERLIAVWITCAATDLSFVYYESTDGPQTSVERPATGTCTVIKGDTAESVSLPASSFAPPALVSGFTITGAQINYDGTAPGGATIVGADTQVFPFHRIDCTKCATPGWWELHSIFWDPTTSSTSFGILYLAQNRPDIVELAYLIRLPELDNPIGVQLDYPATFTTP